MTAVQPPLIRPLGIGQLLDRAIYVYRHNFLTFIAVLAVIEIPIIILQWLATLLTFQQPFDPLENGAPRGALELFDAGYFAGLGGIILISIINFILIQGVVTAVLTQAAASSYLGSPVTLRDAFRQIGGRWRSLLGAILMAILIIIGLAVLAVIPCIGWLTLIVTAGVLLYLFVVVIPLLAPIIILEGQTAAGALRRSWDLARRRFWWTLGFMAVMVLFGQLIITGPATIMVLLSESTSGFLGGDFGGFAVQQAVQSLVNLVGVLIYVPLHATAATLLYLDLRVRTEGFDLALRSAAAGGQAVQIPTLLASTAPAPESGRLVTGSELFSFAGVSFILAGLIALVAILTALGVGAAAGGF